MVVGIEKITYNLININVLGRKNGITINVQKK